MSTLELALALPGTPVPETGVIWSDDQSVSHFRTNLDVAMRRLGPSLTANRDFVRIAVAVFLADCATGRPRSWERHLRVVVPVENPAPWTGSLGALERMLRFLTWDQWTIELVPVDLPPLTGVPAATDADQYMLLSGGADSLSGALTLGSAETTCFVSRSNAGQDAVRRELRRLWGRAPISLSRTVNMRSDKTKGLVSKSPTQRSRSLLVFALGLLPASFGKEPLLVPENGFTSLNASLTPERAGPHSTRTTHPRYIADLREMLDRVGAHGDLSNPYADRTKGEMFSEVAAIWGKPDASKALSASISCAKRTGLRVPKPRGTNHCGLCYGCLVRRAAFRAADLADETLYYADPTHAVGHPGPWHTKRQRADIAAFQYAVALANRPGGLSQIRADLYTARLPAGASYPDAVDLVKRGLDEVAAILP